MSLTWAEVSARLGRNDLPAALATSYFIDCELTDVREIARGIRSAWTGAEWPLQQLDESIWLSLFDLAAGEGEYLHECEPRSRDELPRPLVLYRGCDRRFAEGMSWSSSFEQARWFAKRWNPYDKNETHGLFRIELTDPEPVLAYFHESRSESEYVLDPAYLRDMEIEEIPREEWVAA